VARGDAVAIRNGKTIKADILTAYMVKTAPGQAKPAAASGRQPPTKSGKPSPIPAAAPGTPPASESKISRIDAQGRVVVLNAGERGQGDYGVYNADSGVATLIGNVVVARAKDVIKGQYAVMDLNNNVSRMLPASTETGGPKQRVQGLFVREQQSGAGTPAGPGASPKQGAAAEKKQ